MKTTKVNYNTYMILCAPMLCTITNHLGQSFDLGKTKLRNSKGEIIVFFHDAELAYLTEFYEIDYFCSTNPAGKPFFINNKLIFS